MNIKDFKWTEKRFGTRFATILKNLIAVRKDSTETSLEYEDTQGNVTKLVTDSNFSSLLAKNGLIEVKWQELKDKRDNGQLIPGSLYRITDYNCTTTQENTRSAGHQFDIVLLALSENKLAEEGWAMMNDNIYDVTFDDGVTKKCWLYKTIYGNHDVYNIVDVTTLLGIPDVDPNGEISIDENTKTATTLTYNSTDLTDENLTYNYFQNSNLSAWKVWYCLDNDKSRFAWADDRVDEDSPASIQITPSGGLGDVETYTRDESLDVVKSDTQYYGWTAQGITPNNIYTTTETPAQEDSLFTLNGKGTMSSYSGDIISYTPAQEGTGLPNGRGVIYRLIDEFNNDVAYDFKNIQYIRKLTDGAYDAQGEDTWCYTFNAYNTDDDTCHDLSTDFYKILDDEGKYSVYCSNNHISGSFVSETHYLTNNVFNTQFTIPDDVPFIVNNIIQSGSNGTIEKHSNIDANFFLKISNQYYDMSRVGSPFVYGINIAKMEIIT